MPAVFTVWRNWSRWFMCPFHWSEWTATSSTNESVNSRIGRRILVMARTNELQYREMCVVHVDIVARVRAVLKGILRVQPPKLWRKKLICPSVSLVTVTTEANKNRGGEGVISSFWIFVPFWIKHYECLTFSSAMHFVTVATVSCSPICVTGGPKSGVSNKLLLRILTSIEEVKQTLKENSTILHSVMLHGTGGAENEIPEGLRGNLLIHLLGLL